MLVLSRKPGERILIGDDVTITIVRLGPGNVRVGIEAPRELSIVREEIAGLESGNGKAESGGADVAETVAFAARNVC